MHTVTPISSLCAVYGQSEGIRSKSTISTPLRHGRNLTSGLSQSLIYSILIFLSSKIRPDPGMQVKLRVESCNISAWEFLGKYINLNTISAFSHGNLKLFYCLVPVPKLSEAVEPIACPMKENQVILFVGVFYIAAADGLFSDEIADKSKS